MGFRGVNLGGWLVLERWIAPGVFAGTTAADEFSLCRELGPAEARQRIEEHRRSFITREHVQQLADMGLRVLRLPVGHWLFEAEPPFVTGSEVYVDQLFKWADEFHLEVILDVHAANGSQNGWDHSGIAGEIGWSKPVNIDATLEFVRRLAERYGQQPTLFGIEVLNEPHWSIPIKLLVDYYRQAHAIIDRLCPPGVKVICSDAFRSEEMAKKLANEYLGRIVLDVHLYQLFTPDDKVLDLDGHVRKAAEEWSSLLLRLSKQLPVVVGEWSAAMDEARRQHTGDDYAQYFEAQRATFEDRAIGWVYWTARTQDGGVWSLVHHPEFLKK